jgi:membrane associated rhomboid family serine protease
MGSRRFFRFWCFTVLGGGLLCFVVGLFGTDQAITVGASAGAVALVGAWSWLYPERKLLLMFVVPVKARWLVYGVVAVDVLAGIVGSEVAVWAHLGGLAAAWLMLHGWASPEKLWLRWRRWRLGRDHAHRAHLKVLKGGKSDDDDEPMIH